MERVVGGGVVRGAVVGVAVVGVGGGVIADVAVDASVGTISSGTLEVSWLNGAAIRLMVSRLSSPARTTFRGTAVVAGPR